MSSLLQQGLCSDHDFNNISCRSHEKLDVKKNNRKRKNLLNRYGASKKRKLGPLSSRKQVSPSEHNTHLDSRLTERYPISNSALSSGLISVLQTSQPSPEYDGYTKSVAQDKQWKPKDLELCTHSGLDNRIMAWPQAAQLDTAKLLCSSSTLLSTKALDPVYNSAGDRMDDTSERRVLRPRRVRNKEIKQILPPFGDSALIVGRRIEVYWPLDAAWYCGLISAYDNVRKKHKVSYDDGEEEWLYLAQERFKYEVPSKSELEQSSDKVKNSKFVKDVKEHLALPFSSPNGTSNGSCMLIGKLAAESVKKTSLQAATTVPNVQSPGPTLRTEATFLNSEKDIKFSLRKHKGNPVRLGKGRTALNGSCTEKGSFGFKKRQRRGLKGRPQGADQERSEATKRAQSLDEQDLPEARKTRKKHTSSAKDLFIEGPQNSRKLDGKLEIGDISGAVQVGQPNFRKRKQRSFNVEANTLGGEGELECTHAGGAVHCPTGELDKRIRKKQRVKSLAHRALATEDMVICTVQDSEQAPLAEKATFHSELSLQSHVLLSGDTESNIGCGDQLLPERTIEKLKAGNLNFGLNKRLKRRKYKGVHNRGHGHLRRIANSNRNSSVSTPLKRSQGEHAAVDGDTQFLNTSCDRWFDLENPSSLPHSFTEAASMNCKFAMGLCTGSVSSVKAAMNRSALEGNFSRVLEHHCSLLDARLEHIGSRRNRLRAFYSTIHYSRPDVVCDLFTWQLFNILQVVGLSGGNCFEGRFWWTGSTRDLANIVLLFIFVVQSLLLTSQKCHQCWQGRVLHELWSVLSRKEWSRNLPAALSPQADGLLMQHVRQLISGHSIVNMTSRQMLNIFSSYILKPYIVAVLCEKGAQLRVVMKQYLLSSCPLQDGISFKRQFVRSMELRSNAGAEADFVSCLMLSPVAAYPCMEAHSSERLIQNWISSANNVGYAQLPIPIPSFQLSRNQGLQFTTLSIFSRRSTTCIGHGALYLEQTCDKFGVESWRLASLLLPREAGYFLLNGRFSCFHKFQKLLGLHTGLCFNSTLQKWLDSTGGRHIASGPILKKLLIKVAFAAKEGCRMENFGREQKSQLTPKSTYNDSFDHFGIDHACFNSSEVMEEANVRIPSSPKRNINVTVKAEYSSPGHATQFDKGATPNVFIGSSPIYSLKDFAYSASGSSSNSSGECNTKCKTTKMVDITSGSHNPIGQKGFSVESRYMTPAAHIHLKKRAGSKRRPRGFEHENLDMQHLELSCTANILLSNNSSGWREFGITVQLQSRKSEWVISVQAEGAFYSHKVVESTVTSKVNRYTHAMMWKGGDGWTLEFCDRKQWIHFKRMHEECGHRNARAAFIKQIPIPCVKEIEDSIEGRPYNSSFFGEKWPGEVEYALDCSRRVYDADSEDEKWLADRSQRIDERSSIDVFERIIDKLERVTYLRQGEMVAQDEVTEICESMASENVVLSMHEYWSEKRTRKDNALVRYFELPLPNKFQKQMDNWKHKMEVLENQFPNVTKEWLQGQLPEPPLFAFCWPSRGLNADNMSKRLQRAHSQKYLSSLKYTRTSSFETSEELQRFSCLRSQRVHDLHWYQAAQSGDYWQRRIARDGFSKHLVAGSHSLETDCSFLHEARANAAVARQSAHLYLLRLDSALQRAVAAIIDFETTYATELALMSESATVSSYGCLLSLKSRINQVLNQFASLIGKGDLLERNVGLNAYSDDDVDEHEEDDPSWTVGMQEDGYGNSSLSRSEEGTFLSISERAHLEAWMRSTLRQRAC